MPDWLDEEIEKIIFPLPKWSKNEKIEEITPLRMEEIRKSEERLNKIAEFGPDLRTETAAPKRKMTIPPHNKYSDEIRQNVIRDRKAGDLQKNIAKRYGISRPTVSRIYSEFCGLNDPGI